MEKTLGKLDLFVSSNNFSNLDLVLSFVKSFKEIDTIIIGIDNLMQLKEIINTMNKEINDFPDIYSHDENLINPLNWDLYKSNKKNFKQMKVVALISKNEFNKITKKIMMDIKSNL